MKKRPSELLQGTLDLLVLKALEREPLHGYSILRWLRQVSEDGLKIEEGALYPALHRIENRGWVEAEWGLSESNRQAKFYALTEQGRRQLEVETHSWKSYVEAVAKILAAT
ncbi:MAG TPA: PadR family transcriptional regulator [Thermoanaerobaculia bacterium]|nr:PadR family transcriptional regulator [Thermoanaerobaculia bacterium]